MKTPTLQAAALGTAAVLALALLLFINTAV